MMDVATYINEYKRRKDIGKLKLDFNIFWVYILTFISKAQKLLKILY
jgi:hypothetical protein